MATFLPLHVAVGVITLLAVPAATAPGKQKGLLVVPARRSQPG